MTAKQPSAEASAGVMDDSYATGRQKKPHLVYRYKVRARVAIDGYRRFHPGGAPSRVLEFGAAEGRTLLEMRDILSQQGTFDGIELSDSLLAVAPPMPSNTSLIRGNVMDLPETLEEGSYDLCVALAVLEHLPDPLACVQEALRMLKPGGVFVATCPHPMWDDIAGQFGLVADEHHESKLTMEKMEDLARNAGFSRVDSEAFMWVFTGFLPYLGVSLPPALSLRVDSLVRKFPLSRFGFVNQALFAQK